MKLMNRKCSDEFKRKIDEISDKLVAMLIEESDEIKNRLES